MQFNRRILVAIKGSVDPRPVILRARLIAERLDAEVVLMAASRSLAADAQMDPGKRLDDLDEDSENAESENAGEESEEGNSGNVKKDSENPEKKSREEEEDPVPVNFTIVLSDSTGLEYRVKLGDFQNLQPAIKPQVFKSRLFWEDDESEVTLQYVYLPINKIKIFRMDNTFIFFCKPCFFPFINRKSRNFSIFSIRPYRECISVSI